MHNLRFMSTNATMQQRAPEQNIKPGAVIDAVIVHPVFDEFYLNAHVALQGTAKTPRFTVLKDDNNLSADAIQLLVYTLCFGHQIVRMPTSLPSPVYIATRYAERGRALLGVANERPNTTFDDLQAQLPYSGCGLRNTRINA